MKKKETAQSRYAKKHLTVINARYRKAFVAEFKQACQTLGITQSSVFKNAMEEVIQKPKEKTT